jgi:hypothetical protein
MKNLMFEKFRAKSLGKESLKSIIGGTTYAQCINSCMTANYNAWMPCDNWDAGPVYIFICKPECTQDPNRTSWTIAYDCPY